MRMGAFQNFLVIDQDEGQGRSRGQEAEVESVGCSNRKPRSSTRNQHSHPQIKWEEWEETR